MRSASWNLAIGAGQRQVADLLRYEPFLDLDWFAPTAVGPSGRRYEYVTYHIYYLNEHIRDKC